MSCEKTIVITGGGIGLGAQLTRLYGQAGHRVVICGRTESALRSSEAYGAIDWFCVDLSDPGGRRRFVEGIYELDRPVDLLIHNAGIQQAVDFTAGAVTPERVEAELAINLQAPIEMTGELLPLLRQAPSARIAFVTSALGRVPKQSTPVYCATKAGLSAFARSLRYQLENTGIGVTDIVPDLIRTRMAAGREQSALSAIEAAKAIVRGLEAGHPEIRLGRVPVLYALHRFLPSLAYRMLKAA
jgi:short-subunit dehydrogenase involved in D-alanine esterification of teichoic acids